MRTKILFIAVCLISTTTGFSQDEVPIEEVAGKFYNTYDLSQANNRYIEFEKRAGQWKIATRAYENGSLVPRDTLLFFDKDSGGYQKLPFELSRDTQAVDIWKKLDSYSIAGYHLHKYYGYRGWYRDVIRDLEGKSDLPDESLYSLARAFSANATALLSDQGGDAILAEMFNMPMTRNCMTDAQRQKYKKVIGLSIKHFAQLCKQNSHFETIVGNVAMKVANEVMVEFDAYLTYADSFAASFSLPDHLYPDSVIEKTSRMLNKCPDSAVLLSLGDNDFYPVLYVQQKMSLRKDVYLINQNLLGLDRYIYMASQPHFQSKPIKMSVNDQQYIGNTNDYLMLGDGRSPLDFSAVIDTIQKGHRNEYDLLNLPGKEFVIRRSLWTILSNADTAVHFHLSGDYLLKSDWVLLDIINNLDGRRLCCQTPMYDLWAQLNPYFIRFDENLFVY